MARQWSIRAVSRVLLLFLTAGPVTANFEADFSFYPSGSEYCLELGADEVGCSSASSVSVLNACLCGGNSGFALVVAECFKRNGILDDTPDEVWETMTDACNTSQTPLQVKKSEYDAVFEAEEEEEEEEEEDDDTSTTTTSEEDELTTSTTEPEESTTATAATTDTEGSSATTASLGTTSLAPTETQETEEDSDDDDDEGDSTGISTGAIAGIAIGGVAAFAIAGVLIWWFLRRKQQSPESEHMLPGQGGFQNPHAGPPIYPPTEPMQNIPHGPAHEQDHKMGRYSTVSGLSVSGFTPTQSGSPTPVSPQTHSWGPAGMGYAGSQHHPNSLHPGAYSVPFNAATSPYAAQSHHSFSQNPPIFEMDGSGGTAPQPSEQVAEMAGDSPTQYTSQRALGTR